ncbi:MAG TPA: hypothetical protein VND64_22815 [Pirellulales bacterium]|nr:hypothetical protein [Pirellulales bacterium]
MDSLTRLAVWLNAPANAVGRFILAPIGVLPGWLSATLAATITGVALLAVFKFTSNQRAIKRVKDDIKANLLALKLFNTGAQVALRAQGRVLRAAFRLLALAIVPVLLMTVPVLLVLGQLSLWYEARPLRVGEDALVTMKLGAGAALPEARLEPSAAVDVAIGPVRVRDRREVCWSIQARLTGRHRLEFHVGNLTGEKDLVVGDRFMRVSSLRPDWDFADTLSHPAEKPFTPGSPIRSIAIDYPKRAGWTCGAGTWVVYWFIVSMVSGFGFRRLLNVNM